MAGVVIEDWARAFVIWGGPPGGKRWHAGYRVWGPSGRKSTGFVGGYGFTSWEQAARAACEAARAWPS
jgi:hypothetical protein